MTLERKREWSRNRWIRNGRILFDYKATHPCVDCSEADPIVLEFDHVRGEKIKDLSQMTGAKLEVLYAEMEKCDVVCANCHRRRTAKRGSHHQYGT